MLVFCVASVHMIVTHSKTKAINLDESLLHKCNTIIAEIIWHASS